MAGADAWCEGLAELLDVADADLDVKVVGLVLPHDAVQVGFTLANGLGVAAYRARATDLPGWARPGTGGLNRAASSDLDAHPQGPLESRLGLTGFPNDVRDAFRSRQVFALPESELERSPIAVVGIGGANPLAVHQLAGVETLCRRILDLLNQPESPDAQLERLRRLEAVDERLPMLFGVLDVREIFERVSLIAKDVLPHDVMVLGIFSDDRTTVEVYAQTSATRLPEINRNSWPPLQFDGWLYRVVGDVSRHPVERDSAWRGTGVRSSIRLAIRLDDKTLGVLNFSSRGDRRYGSTDVAIGRHIANYVGLAMSHHQLAEESRGAAILQERAANLESRVRALTDELNERSGYHRVIGDSASWRQVLTQATQVGATETTVLLLGESGTRKEVVARFIHRASLRTRGPFTAINCAALPEHLLEAELFGYERGAFTGASQSKPGQLEQATGGTLFLDEIAEMSQSAQAKLLRVLQEREFQRLGGTRVLKADVRIVAATNRDLEGAMERGQFREDLFYRLSVFAIRLPALRDRREDIPSLSEVFLNDIGRTLGRPPASLSGEARRALEDYHWPGNVRELRNILERAAILSNGGLIAAEHLAFRPVTTKPARADAVTTARSAPASTEKGGDLKSVERAMIENALSSARFNKSQAAKLLGLTRAQLYAKLRRHGLDS
jgi:two-component system response regulator AtoC